MKLQLRLYCGNCKKAIGLIYTDSGEFPDLIQENFREKASRLIKAHRPKCGGAKHDTD